MRNRTLAALVLMGSAVGGACNDNPLGVQHAPPSDASPDLSIATGETFSEVTITDPSSASVSLVLGSVVQMSGVLTYSRGGTLSTSPYATWRSSDNCVATVTSASPSWGAVTGVASGTALIIAEAFGKADTVKVTVSGSSAPTASCYDAEWKWDYRDVSFTGAPSASYALAGGEQLERVVLFAVPKRRYTIGRGRSVTLRSELWYSKGGKANATGYVRYTVTDGSVASISDTGVATGLKSGRTKVIARLGEFADTVPLYVR